MTAQPYCLLGPDDGRPVEMHRAEGGSPFVLTCEHAGREIPRRLGDLGVEESELRRHIAWDIGAAEVARLLSARLDATLILQTYSRLVIDCNRTIDSHDSIPTVSEHTEIPGNRNLHPDEAAARVDEVFRPYHDSIARALDDRRDNGRESVLVALHSFTPVYKGASRPWHVGLLYNRDDRLAHILMNLMNGERGLCLGDNEPYAISDETDYTVPVHGERRGILHIEFEIRQDLVESEAGQREWAERLEDWLTGSLHRLGPFVVDRG
jgi:predicted N-formylglutamate amidohydrolase